MLVSLAVKLKVSLQIGLVVAQLAEVVTTDKETHLKHETFQKLELSRFYYTVMLNEYGTLT